jgi:23S rRNA pseudouridine955/2504/2580 synthase
VHRLDRNTSGLVVFAKTGDASRYLAHQFADHSIRKWYIAIVRGQTPPDGVITAGLGRDRKINRTIVSEDGKAAVTRYVRKASAGGTSVVHIELVSGRTHQIRAHFAHIGHPLWGDVKYGGWHRGLARPSVGSSPRPNASSTAMHQWLHAAWLDFPDGRRLFAPLPHAFVQVLRRLGYPEDAIEAVQRR